MGRLLLTGLSAGYVASLAPAARRFRAAIQAPQAAQDSLLQELLHDQADSERGRTLRLSRVTSFEAFQDTVPISTFDDYRDAVDRIAEGRAGVLTRAPVRAFERTSGSTAGDKLVPYTAGLLAGFSAATGPWLHDLYTTRPALFGTTAYWSVSPAARERETTAGGLPIGFEDDTEYFGPVGRWALGQLLSVPGTVARIPDVDAWRDATLRHLVADARLGLVSVWSPTFLTRLMEALAADPDRYLAPLPARRRAAIDRRLQAAGRLTGPALWPRLRLISCWTDGPAARFVPEMAAFFPGMEIQPKGLLATEGVVTFPYGPGPGAAPALASHVLELVDVEAPGARPLRVHEARRGALYRPLLSTQGGLLRYDLQDGLRCVGHTGRLPRFVFEGRLDRTSDLCGEKLSAPAAGAALAPLEARFCLLAPDPDAHPPAYRLYVEPADPSLDLDLAAAEVEARLAEGHHYRYARDLGQLGPVRARRVAGGAARYEAALMARGVRIGDIKPTPLDPRPFWAEVFEESAS